MFTSVGCLDIRVIELFYKPNNEPKVSMFKSGFKKRTESQLELFQELTILSMNQPDDRVYRSQTFTFTANGTYLVGEEYAISDILSTSVVCIVVYAMKQVSIKRQFSNQVDVEAVTSKIGFVKIPLQRLETDKEVISIVFGFD
jgi:hypothetical protein